MVKAITSVCFIFLLSVANGQEWEVGLQGGASGYMGDINPENPLAFNDWSAGAFVKYNLNHTWGIRGNFAYANTYAHDKHSLVQQRKERNLGFFGPIMEAAVLIDFNFFKWLPQRGRIVYTPYIFAGVGGVLFEPKWRNLTDPETPEINLREYKTEGVEYDNRAITIPFGAGFKYNLRGPWSIGIELGYRLALTDYLDDVSGNYFNFSDFDQKKLPEIKGPDIKTTWGRLSNPSGSPVGTQRGDGRPYDSFMTVGVTLSYTIFKGGCPEWQ